MMLMVRHLQPTEKGIPLEIYCFSKDKVWENYEYIMADILDHVIASVSYFDLELFELENQLLVLQNIKIKAIHRNPECACNNPLYIVLFFYKNTR